MTLTAHQRAYFSGGESPEQIEARARRLFLALVEEFPAYVERRSLQAAVFAGEHFFPGDVIAALRWLEDKGLIERHPLGGKRWRGWWKVTDKGYELAKTTPPTWGGVA